MIEFGVSHRMPHSSITTELDPELLRWNTYHRLFGCVNKGRENFSRTQFYDAKYLKLWDGIMMNIANGILDKGITIEKLVNPSNLAEMLVDMRDLLVNRTFNEIEYIGNYWALAVDRLLQIPADKRCWLTNPKATTTEKPVL